MAVFEIQDGRKFFYQWDLNRKLKVNDSSVEEAHFCYSEAGPVYAVGVEGTDSRTVNVPNELFQSHGTFKVYGYKYNGEEWCLHKNGAGISRRVFRFW